MKWNFNQVVNYIYIRDYVYNQCILNDDFYKVKAHFRGKSNKEYLIISFNKEYDAGFTLIKENDSNLILATYSIKDLFEDKATIVMNSPELKKNLDFQF